VVAAKNTRNAAGAIKRSIAKHGEAIPLAIQEDVVDVSA
jgi:hypothetical protein